MQRTLTNCSLIKKVGATPNQFDRVCEGFAHSEWDDDIDCPLHEVGRS